MACMPHNYSAQPRTGGLKRQRPPVAISSESKDHLIFAGPQVKRNSAQPRDRDMDFSKIQRGSPLLHSKGNIPPKLNANAASKFNL